MEFTEPTTESLEAFDRNGIHCGSARRLPDGTWAARSQQSTIDYPCDTEQAAWNFLQAYGAYRIERGTGMKE